MSKENVEVVRASIEAWNAGDMDAYREAYHPDTIMRSPAGWPEPGPFVGREAVMRQWEQLRGTWDDDLLDPIGDFVDVGDRVAVRIMWRGAGHGPRSNIELTSVTTIRKGTIFSTEFFWDHAEALAAVGHREPEVSPPSIEDALRQSIEGINSKDTALIEASCDPDLELRSSFSAVSGKTYLGYAGAKDYLADMEAAWDDLHLTIEESMPVGEQKRLVVLRVKGMGRGSGVPFDQRTYGVYEFRRGRVLRARFSPSREEALETVGLPE